MDLGTKDRLFGIQAECRGTVVGLVARQTFEFKRVKPHTTVGHIVEDTTELWVSVNGGEERHPELGVLSEWVEDVLADLEKGVQERLVFMYPYRQPIFDALMSLAVEVWVRLDVADVADSWDPDGKLYKLVDQVLLRWCEDQDPFSRQVSVLNLMEDLADIVKAAEMVNTPDARSELLLAVRDEVRPDGGAE